MPEMWMDVDTALSEVPVNIFPLTDDTDFKSRETSVAYNAAGMALVWNFITTGGSFTQTAVTPTTSGVYDWTNQGGGMYSIEIPASGGASINNDTEGFGWFTGVATGVLPWRGPVIGFRAAGLNDKLIDSAYSATRGLAGTALPDAAADAAGGLAISDAGGLDLDAILADTNEVQTKLPAGGALMHAAGAAVAKSPATLAAGDVSGNLPADIQTVKTRAANDVGLNNTAYFGTVAFPTSWPANWNWSTYGGGDTSGVTELLTRIPDATAGETGGLLIAGSNAATTFATLAVTSGNLPADVQTIKTRAVTDVGVGNTVYLGTVAWSTHSAANVVTAMGTGSFLTALPWNPAWDGEVQSEATDALNAYDPPSKAELDSAVTTIRGADGDTLKTLSDQIDGISLGAGTGARTVTITVDDGTDPLQGARVRLTNGELAYLSDTNASGIATFNLDDATYTVAVSKVGYNYAGTTIVVDGTENVTYSMTAIAIAEPDSPDQCTCVGYTRYASGAIYPGQTVTFTMTAAPSTDGNLYNAVKTFTSHETTALLTAILVQGATYTITFGDGSGTSFTVPAESTATLPELIGRVV